MTPIGDRPEISDLVVAFDPETLARMPVRRDDVLYELERHCMPSAARIVDSWPHDRGVLDARFVDGVLARAHGELQRLSEEFQQGQRARRLIAPILATLRGGGVAPPYRIVDVGCGLGYVIRWLAARGELGSDVELIGCDYNASLIALARGLAECERLRCRFEVANAFRLAEPATIFISTGVIHHFRGRDLDRFLGEQATQAQAFAHFDIKPSWLASIGSWVFHRSRMREPLARHDGVLSARRAYTAAMLDAAARRACPSHAIAVFDGRRERLPLLRVMQALIGIRQDLAERQRIEFGPLAARLESVS